MDTITPNEDFLQRSNVAFAEPSSDGNMTVLYIFILLFVIIIASHYAGFNTFRYLGNITDSLGNMILPVWERILTMLGYEVGETARQTVYTSAKGVGGVGKVIEEEAKKVEKATEPVGPSAAENTTSTKKKDHGKGDIAVSAEMIDDMDMQYNSEDEDEMEETIVKKMPGQETITIEKKVKKDLRKAIETNQPTQAELRTLQMGQYKPNDIFSDNNKPNPTTNKSGWCYIGNYKGYRSCSRVGDADKCMSGDIFPSHDVCVNPSLRA